MRKMEINWDEIDKKLCVHFGINPISYENYYLKSPRETRQKLSLNEESAQEIENKLNPGWKIERENPTYPSLHNTGNGMLLLIDEIKKNDIGSVSFIWYKDICRARVIFTHRVVWGEASEDTGPKALVMATARALGII